MLTALRFHIHSLLNLSMRALAGLRSRGWAPMLRRAIGQARPGAATDLPVAPVPTPRAPSRQRPHVLVVDAAPPRPDQDSGSMRLLNLMRLLLLQGYRVTFAADRGTAGEAHARWLEGMGIQVIRNSPVRWLKLHGDGLAAAILCRHYIAAHWLPAIRNLAPGAHVVFDTVDVHFLREQREAELRAGPGPHRGAAATRRRELRLISQTDTTWVVSEAERRLLSGLVPDARIVVLSNIMDRPGTGKPFQERRDLLFVGGHRHPPNTDAVRWLLAEIFPRLQQRSPGIVLHLVGDEVPPDIVATAGQMPGVIVHGHVPLLTPFLQGCRVGLAPLRFGAGVKGKINLSMAHGLPVVATTMGIEGMQLHDGVDVLVADDADSFVNAILRLYHDPALWEELSRNGSRNVERYFSFDAAARALELTLGPAPGCPDPGTTSLRPDPLP